MVELLGETLPTYETAPKLLSIADEYGLGQPHILPVSDAPNAIFGLKEVITRLNNR
jgi:hypothetical protein